jgi:transcriptional regulator with XRE-family HTH domain
MRKMSNKNHVFAKRFKELREARGLTQDMMAEKLGLSRSGVANYESSDPKIPRESRLKKIANLFDCSIDYLLGETDNPTPVKNEKQDNSQELDLKQIKKALLEKELVYDGHKLTKKIVLEPFCLLL